MKYSSPNPVKSFRAEYCGPFMRSVRVMNVMIRITTNIFIWKDPLLSFWVLVFLLLLAFTLIIFPWRWILFLLGTVLFGPQNLCLKDVILKWLRRGSDSTK